MHRAAAAAAPLLAAPPLPALLRQRRCVLLPPPHILANRQRAGEYKIARIRLSASLAEAKKVLEHYRTAGILEPAEANVMINQAGLAQDVAAGEWAIGLRREVFSGQGLSVMDLNTELAFYAKTAQLTKAMGVCLEMRRLALVPNNDTYATILAVCAAAQTSGSSCGNAHKRRRAYKELASYVLDEVLPSLLLFDGRYTLMRSARVYCRKVGDEEGEARFAKMMLSDGDAAARRKGSGAKSALDETKFERLIEQQAHWNLPNAKQ
eukprot:Rhum_TRINITY_DN2841_c0_g1::Rhum_TRINITY_DN2841_c0_g1_i1::g.8403::m.8403